MTRTTLRRIPVGSSSESSQIDSRRRYHVRIDGRWYTGSFSRQWFGWRFDDYRTSGLQLNLIEQVFEIRRADSSKRSRNNAT